MITEAMEAANGCADNALANLTYHILRKETQGVIASSEEAARQCGATSQQIEAAISKRR